MSEEKISSLNELLNLFSFKEKSEIPEQKEENSKNILVFKTSLLDSLGKFQGILTGEDCQLYLQEILIPENLLWIPRNIAEKSPEYKQVIPYCVITCANKTFSYRRNKKGNESRLHNMKSIGIGGHIEQSDLDNVDDLYNSAMWREIDEEIALNKGLVKSNKIIGIINDDSDDVGKVHFGIVHNLKMKTTDCMGLLENKLSDGGWEFTGYLKNDIDQWENWSVFVINELMSELKSK